ncbi:larval cuticle protein 1-like [Drosophila innubila]|uniref:larval cuticle protein 1-like n=1 Tax=Drosophila innubila TaxID=198719 RepID=UPI00148D7BF6|nr:larval cuticle protein 1-like [Drosophila innubila]
MFKVLMICAVVGIAVGSPLSVGRLPHAVSHPVPRPAPRPVPHQVPHAVVHVSGDDVHAEQTARSDDVRADGFKYVYETSNHINEDRDGNEHGDIHGSFSYISPEGEHIKVDYVANEHGYQPQGSHLPTPPPIPEAIQRSIEYIAAHTPAPESHGHH